MNNYFFISMLELKVLFTNLLKVANTEIITGERKEGARPAPHPSCSNYLFPPSRFAFSISISTCRWERAATALGWAGVPTHYVSIWKSFVDCCPRQSTNDKSQSAQEKVIMG